MIYYGDQNDQAVERLPSNTLRVGVVTYSVMDIIKRRIYINIYRFTITKTKRSLGIMSRLLFDFSF